MEDAKRIYSLLLRSDGLKIREIAQALELEKLYVAELLFSEECNPFWYQNDDSLWFAKIGALQIEEGDNDIEERDSIFDIVVNASPLEIKQYRELGVSDTALLIITEISSFRVFTDDQTQELFLRYDDGDKDAYELLVKGNLRHVVAVARLFLNTGIPFEDIIQEGTLGLLAAIRRFDYRFNRNFTYFAKLGIYRHLDLSLKSIQFQVKISPRHIYLHRLIRRFCDDYVQKEEMEPPFEFVEIKEEVSPDFLKPLYNLPPDLQDMVICKNDWDEVADDTFLADKQMMANSRRFDLLQFVHTLPPRMCDIVESFFGLNGKPEETLEMIGTRLNLTRERVRQIKEKGVRTLKKLLLIKVNASSASEPMSERLRKIGVMLTAILTEGTDIQPVVRQRLRTDVRRPKKNVEPKGKKPSLEDRYHQALSNSYRINLQKKTKSEIEPAPKAYQKTKNIEYQKRQDLRKAIKQALEHYTVPVTHYDVAIVARKYLPHNFEFTSMEVESILWTMKDVDLVQGRKYILKSKNKISPYPRTTPVEDTKKESETVASLRFYPSTRLEYLVDLKIITRKECKHCHHKGLSTIGDVKAIIKRYHLTRQSNRFTQYTLDIWFKISDLLKDETRGEPAKEIIETPQNNDLDRVYSKYLNKIMRIRQAKKYGEVIVAKPVLLLAIIDGIESQVFTNNSIQLNDWLEARYEGLMRQYTRHSQFNGFSPINNPFWHLESDGFWHLHFRGKPVRSITPTTKWLKENVSYASFDHDLWILLQNQVMRQRLRDYIKSNKLAN